MLCACGGSPAPEEGQAGEPLRAFEGVVKDIWRKDARQTAFCKDFPRLCRRLVIRNSRIPEEKAWAHEAAENTVGIMQDVLLYVMSELEPELLNQRTEALQRVGKEMHGAQDHEEACRELVDAAGGEESRAVRVLKLINQNLVLAAVEHLHYTACKDLAMKDVRSEKGWRVCLHLEESRVLLQHIRRQQSLDAFGDTGEHFELEFEVTCTFERAEAALKTATLRIIRLDTAESMSADRRSQLRARLLGDVLIG